MNIAQARPRTWTPHIILFSIVFHVVVLYAIAVSFNIVPPPSEVINATPVTMTRINPPPPVVKEPEKIEKEPRIRPRPVTQTIPPVVEPLYFPPQPPKESTANANVVALNEPIQEVPVSQPLPRYPRQAEARQIEGRVVLSITIMPDGSVRDVRVVNAQPRGYFEDAAVRSVQRWRYRASNVTRTNVIVHMDFELKGA
jgi:protein TonB